VGRSSSIESTIDDADDAVALTHSLIVGQKFSLNLAFLPSNADA